MLLTTPDASERGTVMHNAGTPSSPSATSHCCGMKVQVHGNVTCTTDTVECDCGHWLIRLSFWSSINMSCENLSTSHETTPVYRTIFIQSVCNGVRCEDLEPLAVQRTTVRTISLCIDTFSKVPMVYVGTQYSKHAFNAYQS